MKVMAWNVQGAKKHQIRDEIRVINQTHRPDLLFMIETMVSEQTTRKLIAKLGFEHFDFVSPQIIRVVFGFCGIMLTYMPTSYLKKIELFICLLWM